MIEEIFGGSPGNSQLNDSPLGISDFFSDDEDEGYMEINFPNLGDEFDNVVEGIFENDYYENTNTTDGTPKQFSLSLRTDPDDESKTITAAKYCPTHSNYKAAVANAKTKIKKELTEAVNKHGDLKDKTTKAVGVEISERDLKMEAIKSNPFTLKEALKNIGRLQSVATHYLFDLLLTLLQDGSYAKSNDGDGFAVLRNFTNLQVLIFGSESETSENFGGLHKYIGEGKYMDGDLDDMINTIELYVKTINRDVLTLVPEEYQTYLFGKALQQLHICFSDMASEIIQTFENMTKGDDKSVLKWKNAIFEARKRYLARNKSDDRKATSVNAVQGNRNYSRDSDKEIHDTMDYSGRT